MPTVLSIHDDARALLNDTFGDVFSDAVLLPFTKKAYQELQDEMAENSLGDIEEETADIPVLAGATEIGSGTGLPTDLIVPVTLYYQDAQGEFVEFTEKDWVPGVDQIEVQQFWKWREGVIKLVGATVASVVRIKYIKFLPAIVNTASNIPIINCSVYMAAKVAAIAAYSVGNNPERASGYNIDAEKRLKKIINTLVKRKQSEPTRRQPFHK